MLIDVGWLLIAAAIHHYAVGRRTSDNRARRLASAEFISWAIFKTMSRAVSVGGGSVGEALVTGTVFGAIVLAVVILAQLRGLARSLPREPGTD